MSEFKGSVTVIGFAMAVFMRKVFSKPLLQNQCYRKFINQKIITMENEIKLLKNNDKRADSDLEWIQEFYMFLQGEVPETISLRRNSIVKLSKQKAFTIIWYLQEHFSVFPDTIEQCSQCGELYDSESEGIYWETKGKHYCGGCCDVVPYNYDRGRR